MPLPEWIRYLLAALATYRMAQLIAIDEGPASIFLRLRTALGTYDRGPNGEATSIWGRFIGCPYCVGLWVSLVAAAACIWPTYPGDFILIWFGMAGLAAYLQGPRMGQ